MALEVKRSDRHLFSRRRCDVIRDGHLSPFITLEKGGSRAEVIATKKKYFLSLVERGEVGQRRLLEKKKSRNSLGQPFLPSNVFLFGSCS